MAFWGVEVKPGRPFVHTYASESGPLRLSQATLGIGTAIERSILQCNVGDKAPVLLCSLLPNRIESTCLELEFEEKGAVVFSVIGPRSVHLAGYFLRGSSRRGGGDGNESESFGEDIWDTGSNESGSFHSSEDKYESDFIDDGDVEISALPRRDSEAIVEEILEEKPARKRTHRHLRKKQQIIESDDEGLVSHSQINNHEKSSFSESEEEDGLPISFSISNRKKKADGNLKLNTVVLDTDKNSKPAAVMNEKGLEREDKVVAVNGGKSKKKSKDKIKSSESLETHNAIPDGNMQARGNVDQSKYADNTRDQTKKVNLDNAYEVIQSESSGKTRKKKKEKVRQGETKAEVEPTVDKSEGTAAMEKMDNKKHEHPADESGDKVVYNDKDVLDSHDKLRRKKKKAKTKSDVEVENDEILQKDGTEIQTMDVATIEAPTSHKKRDKKSTASGPLPDMTLNVNEEAQFADVPHEPNRRKQKKMKSM